MHTWTINEANGRYVGQQKSAEPAVAFCDYMGLYQERPRESEVRSEKIGDEEYRVIYRSREFVVRKFN